MNDLQTALSHIDLIALIERDLGQPRQRSDRWVMWLCPFHPDYKTPSLAVNVDKGFWHCFGCNKNGNALTWMCLYHKMEVQDALISLGVRPDTTHLQSHAKKLTNKRRSPMQTAHPIEDSLGEPSETWQKRGLAFVDYSQQQLWQTAEALRYLHQQRLLEDYTIQHFRLGYNPSDLWDRPERWGFSQAESKRIWLPKGYVIPCFVGDSLWYIKIRRMGGEPKYLHVRGSSPAMFGTGSLGGAPLILLTEGEFDCMLTWQLLRDIAGVATLGSASKKLDLKRWMQYLLPAEEIVAVLDNDSAGKQGAQMLAGLSAQIHPVRIPSLSPSASDITDYVRDGGDLWEWLKHHLAAIENRASR